MRKAILMVSMVLLALAAFVPAALAQTADDASCEPGVDCQDVFTGGETEGFDFGGFFGDVPSPPSGFDGFEGPGQEGPSVEPPDEGEPIMMPGDIGGGFEEADFGFDLEGFLGDDFDLEGFFGDGFFEGFFGSDGTEVDADCEAEIEGECNDTFGDDSGPLTPEDEAALNSGNDMEEPPEDNLFDPQAATAGDGQYESSDEEPPSLEAATAGDGQYDQ